MRNEKGFTLLELMAVIVLATTVLMPMLSGLIGNYEVNARMHQRKAASSLTLTTIEAFDKVDYADLKDMMDASLATNDPIIQITEADCTNGSFTTTTITNQLKSSAEVCTMIFNQEWNGIQFAGADAFKVYLYPYHLTTTQKDAILNDATIPQSVKSEIEPLTPSNETNPEVLRLSIWILYDEKTEKNIVSSGVVNSD